MVETLEVRARDLGVKITADSRLFMAGIQRTKIAHFRFRVKVNFIMGWFKKRTRPLIYRDKQRGWS